MKLKSNIAKRLAYALSIVVLVAASACCDRKPKAPERLPDEELAAYREAVIKLYPYVVLKDSAYHITISKSEAAKLRIPGKYFDRLKEDLDYTNHIIREEYIKRGIPIEMPLPQCDTTTLSPHHFIYDSSADNT